MSIKPEHLDYVFRQLKCKCVRCNKSLDIKQRIVGQPGVWGLFNVNWKDTEDAKVWWGEYEQSLKYSRPVNLGGLQIYCLDCLDKVTAEVCVRYRGINHKPISKKAAKTMKKAMETEGTEGTVGTV